MTSLNGYTAFITGGGSGLGRAFAKAACKRNINVILADIQADSLNQTVEELRSLGGKVSSITVDVADAAAMHRCSDEVHRLHGPVHLVFNNAGVTSSGPVWESTDKDWDWLLGVNLKGVINGIRSFVPQMLANAKRDPSYRGKVVNTASMAGLITAPGMGIYSVSKHAVVALSECLHHDLQLATTQVEVAVLCPSYVPTAIGNSERNRPTHLANDAPPTKLQLASREAAQQAVSQGGISADAVAEITFQAIEDGRFYIFPSPETLVAVKPRFAHILDQSNPQLPYELFPALKDRRDKMLKSMNQ
ncbi:MAG TPA: SDR family oxidoreductase [Rhodoferax sp.]|jgi:NAD(P)-dependent dehydrogenase (short-subunit alcohol dehydrogenase family)|nr:SDR family oxidoreductase [Rhodoferax sp.]HQC86291.1 SDR family oxidoreductase [Rhodoferax sp.]